MGIFCSSVKARNAAWVIESNMAFRDDIDDGFEAVLFLEQR